MSCSRDRDFFAQCRVSQRILGIVVASVNPYERIKGLLFLSLLAIDFTNSFAYINRAIKVCIA